MQQQRRTGRARTGLRAVTPLYVGVGVLLGLVLVMPATRPDLTRQQGTAGEYSDAWSSAQIAFADDLVARTEGALERYLAEYVRTILAGGSRVDRFLYCGDESALTPQERQGWELFSGRANCVVCHTVQHESVGLGGGLAPFTDGRFHVIGAGQSEDAGRGAVTGVPTDDGAFETPTLRNISLTAPYMHDGSMTTLEEVIDFYDQGGGDVAGQDRNIVPLSLSEEEKAALVALLRALESPEDGVRPG